MEQARTLEAVAEESPLAHARLQRRLRALAAFAAVLAAAAVAVVLGAHGSEPGPSAAAASAATLPAPWAVKVVVLNGGGDIVYTRSVASRVQALSYRVVHVGRASSLNYLQTAVYFPPGGQAVCTRLAQQIGVPVQPLPGGTDPRRCVLVVGPKRRPGS